MSQISVSRVSPAHTVSASTRLERCLLILVFALGLAYVAKGTYQLSLGEDRTDAIDLRQKWVEYRYFQSRQNPYDVWLQHGPFRQSPEAALSRTRRGPARYSSELGVADASSPPWSYVPGLLLLWPAWPEVRFYFAALNAVAALAISALCFRLLAHRGPRLALWGAACGLAMGSTTSAIAVGQYSILVTAMLAAALVLTASGPRAAGRGGMLLALALIKPTMSAPFVVALVLGRRWRTTAWVAGTCAVWSLASWTWLRTSPLEMVHQLSLVGRYLASGGTLGLTQALSGMGLSAAAAVQGPMIAGLLVLAAGTMTIPAAPLLTRFALSGVVARLWSYHYSHDDSLVLFLFLALLDRAGGTAGRGARLATYAVAATLILPGAVIKLPWFQALQLLTWGAAAIYLWQSEAAQHRAGEGTPTRGQRSGLLIQSRTNLPVN